MKMTQLIRKTYLVIVGILAAGVLSGTAYADEVLCPTQYGSTQYGTTPCPQNLVVNKLVRNPITGSYVENLLEGDAAYSPRSEVVYEVRVTNSSNTDFDRVQVQDTVEAELKNPRVVDVSQVETIETPDQQTLRFVVRNVKAGETRTVLVKAEVVSDVRVESGKSRKCEITNKVKVEASGQQPDEDTADLCVVPPTSPEVLGAVTLPKAGLEDITPMLPFAGLAFTGIALFIKKKR